MMQASQFESYSLQHFGALIIFAVFTFLIIWFGLNTDKRTQWKLAIGVAFIGCAIMIFDLIYRLLTGTFDVKNDLPLFLCDVVVLMLPFVVWHTNRKWLGILYFWALAGTFQALLTPELENGFPALDYFRYFIMHGGIVTVILYCIVVYRIRIGWRDLGFAILYAQAYLIIVHVVNMLLKSNYSYTIEKPVSATILDLMGPWPWYILLAELAMGILFLMLMLPFIIPKSATAISRNGKF